MKLLVGLGNPGKKYARNRHNIGFMAVDEIARAFSFSPWRNRFKGEVSEGLINGQKCLAIKPHTFMNLSGEAVREAAQFYKIPLEDIIVIHDEIDLAAAKVKLKSGGGNAGHNGLKSISAHMGNDYVRIRLGVGRPTERADVANYVLRDFAKAEQPWIDDVINALCRHAGLLVEDKATDFMSKVGNDLRPSGGTDNKTSAKKKDRPKDIQTSKKAQQPDLTKKPAKTKKSDKTNNKSSGKGALGAALDKWLGSTPPKGDK